MPPEIDSSAQYRSVIMPKIFGGGVVEKPLKTGSGPYQRQRYYKPANSTTKSGCLPSPYSTYLTEEDQADLYILVKSARSDGVDQADIKMLMEEYARNSMSPKKFSQFLKDCRRFENCLEKKRIERKRRAIPRLFSKRRPQAIKPKNRRHLQDQLNEQYFMNKNKSPTMEQQAFNF
ncbi:hypothetical protein M3Y97_00133400 [Aphelenchoides bicaudatus]|nr:hypothetical protein M3Y97_00133400 [Aphelenchoides bicaudatus]